MKKRKLLFLLPLSGMILSGCDFDPQALLKNTGDFFTQTIPSEFQKIVDGITGKKSEEPQKEEKSEDEKKELVSISVSGQFQQLYDIGEEFDPTGIVVTAVYDDQSTADVSSQASFSGFDSSEAGNTTVTVSFGGQTATLTFSVAKLSWSAEEKALFDQHLHGIELPFFEEEGAVLSADEDGVLHIFDAEGENLEVEGDTIADYAAKFSADDGWEDVSSDYGAYSSAEEGSFWVFEKSTQTEDGMRRISVQFFGYDADEGEYVNDGAFYMFASDPFSYEFPADLMAAEFEYYEMTPFTLPAPDGEGLWFEFYPDSYNAVYYAYGYEDYMNATIYIYGFTQETFEDYVAKLENAGWVFESQVMSGVTVRSGKLEIEDVGTAYIEQLYIYGNFTALTYDYLIAEPAVWPEEAAAALVEKFAPGSETVLPECPGGESYDSYMSTNYNEIDVGGDESLKDEYAAILADAGWTETEEGSYIFVSPAEDIQVTLQYTSYGLEIRVAAYIPPAAEWPAEDAAKLLPEGGQDSLPPFEGADSYQYYNDSYGAGISCFVGEGNEESAMEAYAATLVQAGFTLGSDGFYKSAHDEIKVELWKGTGGAFNIEVTIIAHWPTADVAELMAVLNPDGLDSLPALEGADQYASSGTDEKVRVQALFATSSDAVAAQSAYGALLEQAGFTYAGDDEYGDPYYNSEHSEINVNLWVSSRVLIIDVYPGSFTPPTAGFPADDINAALKALEPTLTDTLPAYTTDLIYTFDEGTTGVQIMAMPDDVDDEIEAFCANLLANGYTEAGADTYGDMHYSSPNGELDVCAWNYGDYYIVVDVEIN